MKDRSGRRRMLYGLVLPGLVALSCWGCESFGGAEDAGPGDSRMYEGCDDGRSLVTVEKVYGIVIPDTVADLRFCEQEDWSGSAGEVQFDASRKEWGEFLAGSRRPDLEMVKIKPSVEGRKWQRIPKGVEMEYGTYDNTTAGCDNSVYIHVQALRADLLRVYLKLVCAA